MFASVSTGSGGRPPVVSASAGRALKREPAAATAAKALLDLRKDLRLREGSSHPRARLLLVLVVILFNLHWIWIREREAGYF